MVLRTMEKNQRKEKGSRVSELHLNSPMTMYTASPFQKVKALMRC